MHVRLCGRKYTGENMRPNMRFTHVNVRVSVWKCVRLGGNMRPHMKLFFFF
jgi:hypothetical protein